MCKEMVQPTCEDEKKTVWKRDVRKFHEAEEFNVSKVAWTAFGFLAQNGEVMPENRGK
jgi:hypothetical protein